MNSKVSSETVRSSMYTINLKTVAVLWWYLIWNFEFLNAQIGVTVCTGGGTECVVLPNSICDQFNTLTCVCSTTQRYQAKPDKSGCDYNCGTLTNPTNGAVSTTGTLQTSFATYTCSAGFKLTGVSTRTCVLGSGWSGVAPTCVAASGKCPDGFLAFNVSCYHFSNDVATWYSSQVACNQAFSKKADLVEINGYEENHFLWQHAQATKRDYWVGASELQTLNVYRWLKSTKVVNTLASYWAPGEPTGVKSTEHCMAIMHGASTSNCWNDITCYVLHYFICETPNY